MANPRTNTKPIAPAKKPSAIPMGSRGAAAVWTKGFLFKVSLGRKVSLAKLYRGVV